MDARNTQKIIFRIESGIKKEDIPADLSIAIVKELGLTATQIKAISPSSIDEDEDYAKHYSDRIEAINEGVAFFLDALPSPSKKIRDQLKAFLNEAAEDCIEHLQGIQDPEKFDIAYYQNSLVNYVKYIKAILHAELGMKESEIKHQLGRAEEFALAMKKKPPICTIKKMEGTADEYIVMIDQPLNPIGPNDKWIKDELKRIQNEFTDEVRRPIWYQKLKTYEQDFLRHFLKGKDLDITADFSEVMNALSSKLRIIPVPANYGKHTLITYTRKENATLDTGPTLKVHPSEIRSSHIASRDVPSKNKYTRRTHASRNLRKMILDALKDKLEKLKVAEGDVINIPILFQTLITPLITPDYYLAQDKANAVEAIQRELQERQSSLYNFIGDFENNNKVKINCQIYSTNHPLNPGKYIVPTNPLSDTQQAENELVAAAKSSTEFQQGGLLKLASDALEQSSVIDLFESYRELYLSSLEQLIAGELNGISIGSCVSGKDRKAVEIAHTDAMKVFFKKYGRIPAMIPDKSNQKDTENFAKIFAEIYCSKHQQALAGQNAPGSFGTKTPDKYLPDHLSAAVHQWYKTQARKVGAPDVYKKMQDKDTLNESDIMATNNEIHKIVARNEKIDNKKVWHPSPSKRVKNPSLLMLDDQSIATVLDAVGQGITTYLATGKNRMGFYAKHFGWEKRKDIALYLGLQFNNSDMNAFQKSILLYAILAMHEGKTLQRDIAQSLGFTTRGAARQSIMQYIRVKVDSEKMAIDHINEAVGAIVKVIHHPAKYQSDAVSTILNNLTQTPKLNTSTSKPRSTRSTAM